MASIDYYEAKKQLEKILSTRDVDNHRKIVFWYDEAKTFFDDVQIDRFDNSKVVIFDNNPLYIKFLLEKVDVLNNYLVYFPCAKPANTENWLLDILMYSEEYYADRVALTMRQLGLTNTDLRQIIERFINFYDNSVRRAKLQSIVSVCDSMKENDLFYGMMAVLSKAKYAKLEDIVRELVFDFDKTKYEDLTRFGFDKFLWQEINKYYGYSGLEKIDNLVRTFFITALTRRTKLENGMPSSYNAFVMKDNSEDAEIFLGRIKSDERYRDLQYEYSKKFNFLEYFKRNNIVDFKQCDIFEDIDAIVVARICETLVNGTYDFDFLHRIINDNRKVSIWWKNYEHQYQMLDAAISFFQSIDIEIPFDLSAEEYATNYAKTYYKIDLYYRHALSQYSLIDEPSELMVELEKKINLDYETIYLSRLSRCFNPALTSLKGRWNFKSTLISQKFYDRLDGKNNKMFVIISDALRYEIGSELFEQINVNPVLRGSAVLDYAICPIPSITKFGMASLLPNKKIELIDGKVYVDGLVSLGVESRDKILKTRGSSNVAVNFSTIMQMNQRELRQFMADKTLVYIYHDVIDATGESDEHKVFQVVDESIQDIINLIKKLYNNLQITNYVITADHGFMYRRQTIQESEKYSNIVGLKAIETSKRYLIAEGGIGVDYTHTFKLDYLGDTKHEVVTAFGYDTFKTQGGGLNFIHGGTSLQEIVVPVIRISEMRSKNDKNQKGPVGVRLKSITRKLTARTFSLEFEQFEKVEEKKTERSVLVYFVDATGKTVSGKYQFYANSKDDNLMSRVSSVRFSLENIDFSRNKQYDLVLFDQEKDEEFDRISFVIDLINIKPAF